MQTGIEMRIAVLIDADNVPHDKLDGMMKEITRYGTPTIKRIYGDWTKPDLKGWKNLLLSNAITPIQQYRYTVGKNATDSAMIIEAMDMLYGGNVDAFFIVSSDSDFTRLALRLRESGKRVYGMGERKTPRPFIVACDKFTYIEIIDMPVEKVSRMFLSGSSKNSFEDVKGKETSIMPDKVKIDKNLKSRVRRTKVIPKTIAAVKPEKEALLAKKEIAPVKKEDTITKTDMRSKVMSEEMSQNEISTAISDSRMAMKENITYEKSNDEKNIDEKSHQSGNDDTSGNTQPVQENEHHSRVEHVTQEMIELIASSITDLADENGWAFLGDVGTLIAKKKTDFDPRNYGFVKLTPFIRALEVFELDIRETSQYHIKHVYVRNKQ